MARVGAACVAQNTHRKKMYFGIFFGIKCKKQPITNLNFLDSLEAMVQFSS